MENFQNVCQFIVCGFQHSCFHNKIKSKKRIKDIRTNINFRNKHKIWCTTKCVLSLYSMHFFVYIEKILCNYIENSRSVTAYNSINVHLHKKSSPCWKSTRQSILFITLLVLCNSLKENALQIFVALLGDGVLFFFFSQLYESNEILTNVSFLFIPVYMIQFLEFIPDNNKQKQKKHQWWSWINGIQ